jgi:beta-N-acetylhexosaminidase
MPNPTQRDLRADAGQLLIMGFDGTELTAELRSMLAEFQPGGVILFARNILSTTDGPRQTWELLRDCQKARRPNKRSTLTADPAPLYCCVDMEGGTVDRLKDVIAPAPSAADVFNAAAAPPALRGAAKASLRERKRLALFRTHGALIGRECCTLGFNVDFAPVFDLAFAPSRTVLTSRTVSDDPKQAILYAREFLRGLRDSHVLGCGKHFPGLGEANLDTHKELPSIDKSFKRLWDEDLAPYRALRRQMPFVMVAHASYPQVTHDTVPASLSKKWIAEILRKRIGYNGLIISDDLEMGGVLPLSRPAQQRRSPGTPAGLADYSAIGEAAVRTIEAGADIYLVCHKAEAVRAAYETVLRHAESNRRFAQRVHESATRIRRAKRNAGVGERRIPAPSEAVINRLRCAIWEFQEELRAASLEEHTDPERPAGNNKIADAQVSAKTRLGKRTRP